MDYEKLDKIGAWLNSKGFDIDLTDEFWMEEYRFSEMKVRDLAELLIDYENEFKKLNTPQVSKCVDSEREHSVCSCCHNSFEGQIFCLDCFEKAVKAN